MPIQPLLDIISSLYQFFVSHDLDACALRLVRRRLPFIQSLQCVPQSGRLHISIIVLATSAAVSA